MSNAAMPAADRTTRASTRARISAPPGAFVLPVATPYEWEVFCEHLSAAARQRGTVRVRIGAFQCEVRGGRAERAASRCAGCAGRVHAVALRITSRDFCLRCARHCLGEELVTTPSGATR